ncbi:sulfatase [Pontiella sulfatireligans]|uniref:Choline-sulfatase n=1 Tax=Pontiella sulfatireligans TaxID=2750658 RepID=A0A6C2UL07_9BACT|nr:sulfatase [Pontiella sulfatireligans]SPS74460.1 sulfatase S1_54 [Kiritimatiellales bacterium]VGO20910.1 Choline-sulfatase [Pontiella sulfatireligans]
MHKYIKTFYLWLGIFSLCNAVSLGLALALQPIAPGVLWLYPMALAMQLPLVLAISLSHYGLNHLFSILPKAGKKAARFVLSALGIIVFLGIYTASLQMYFEVNSFIAWDTLQAVLLDTLQILPDIGRSNGMELSLIGAVAIAAAGFYTARYHDKKHVPSPKLFAILCAVFIASGAGSFALVYGAPNHAFKSVRRDLLPTTYLTLSIIDDLIPATWPAGYAMADLALKPSLSLDDYFQTHPMKPKTNVFFIMLEAVSWDHLGFTGYRRQGVTPNLDALAAESLVFPRTYAAANHSNYSQTSTHSSQYPLRRNHLDQFDKVDYPKTLLFDVLSHAGYQTAFFSAQNEDWQGMKKFILANTELQHFYHSQDELGGNIGIESKVDDAQVRTHAVDFLEQRSAGRPIFMYLNFQRTHFPYDLDEDAPRPYQPCSTDDFEFKYFNYDQRYVENVVNKYDNALHYVDQQVGAFIDHLKQKGLYEDSLIVIASDHGEAFYAHGYPTHSTTLYDDQIRTSTLFKLPGASSKGVRRDAISLIDINPTILEILGQPNHPNFQGRQVCGQPREGFIYLLSHAIVKMHGIVDYPWKYISCERDGERLLNVELDPMEAADLSELYPEKLEQLKQELTAYQQRQMYYYSVLSEKKRSEFYPPQH